MNGALVLIHLHVHLHQLRHLPLLQLQDWSIEYFDPATCSSTRCTCSSSSVHHHQYESIIIIQQTPQTLSYYRSEGPITTIGIAGQTKPISPHSNHSRERDNQEALACYDKTARVEQKEEDRQNMTARTGQPEQEARTRQPEQDNQNRTAKREQPEQHSQNGTAEQSMQNRTDRTGF